MGIKPGPIYREIKENEETILSSGETIKREDFLGPTKKGRVISIIGDTRYIPKLSNFIKTSDVLVHEATFDASRVDLAKDYFHSTSEQTALLAKESGVGTLIITHISSRYQDADVEDLLQEAKAIFPNTFLAHDFYTHHIK